MARKGLGRTFDSLIGINDIPETTAATPADELVVSDEKRIESLRSKIEKEVKGDEVKEIDITDIDPNYEQPRKNFDQQALNELAESIRQHGIIQPLVVRKKGNFYEIVAGERRWRAANICGLKKVPAVIRNYTDKQVKEISIIIDGNISQFFS